MRINLVAIREDLWAGYGHTVIDHSSPESTHRTIMLWDLLKQSRRLLQGFIDIPESELPSIPLFALMTLCQSISCCLQTVPILLQLIKGDTSNRGPLTSSQRAEAQAILDEADFDRIAEQLQKKIGPLVIGIPSEDRETHGIGSLWYETRILRQYYPRHVNAILGENLLSHSGITIEPVSDPVMAGAEIQRSEWTGADMPMSWPDLDLNFDDSGFVMDTTQWTTFLQSINLGQLI